MLLGRHDLPAARVAFEQARAALAAVRSGRPFFATMTLGWVVEEARVYFEETVLPGPRVSAGQAQGYVLCNLAYLARLAGDRDEARTLLDEAGSIFRALGARDGESMALSHLGCLHRVRAEFAEGRAALEHSLRIRHEIGDRREIGLTLGNLGMLTAAEGDLAHGLALLQQALAGFRRPRTRRDGLPPRSQSRACELRRATTKRHGACCPTRCPNRGASPATTAQPRGDSSCWATCTATSANPTKPPSRWPRPGGSSGRSVAARSLLSAPKRLRSRAP